MISILEIKPCIGLSNLMFGASMTDISKIVGPAEETELLDDLDDCQSTVWHYWEHGFSLFFDERNHRLFGCVEIDNSEAVLWEKKIFTLNEKQIIDLFKSKNIT